ncbi:MAG TPA: hypothetical protein VLV87_01310, partial [Gammaproteobacteria bacterium]|nr:hypothetical protein [Gammaproteobacteria bacterium]
AFLLIYCCIEQAVFFSSSHEKAAQMLVMGYAMFMLSIIFIMGFSLHLQNWAKIRKTSSYYIFEKVLVPYVFISWRLKYDLTALAVHPLLIGVAVVLVLVWTAWSGIVGPQLIKYLAGPLAPSDDDTAGVDGRTKDRLDILNFDLLSLALILMPILFWRVGLVFAME